jgi:hypothetical protein
MERTCEGMSVLSGMPIEHSITRCGGLARASRPAAACLPAVAARASDDSHGGSGSDLGVLFMSLLVDMLSSAGGGVVFAFLLGDGMAVKGKLIVMMGIW